MGGVLFLACVRQNESILEATASFEHMRIIWAVVAFADDIRAAKLELWRQRRGTSPFDVLGGEAGTLIHAADHVGLVEALGAATDAVELLPLSAKAFPEWSKKMAYLRQGIDSAMRRQVALAECQGLDLGERNGVFGSGEVRGLRWLGEDGAEHKQGRRESLR